jgi:hypothetical protein
MGITIHEDIRSLADMYPDPDVRHKIHYTFAHRFLPQYIHSNPQAFFTYLYPQDIGDGVMEPVRFIQSRWTMFEEELGLLPIKPLEEGMLLRRITDLSMSLHEVTGSPVAFIQMPTPERPAEAFFVAAVLLTSTKSPKQWARDIQARVFTLEAEISSDGKEGLLCEWDRGGRHLNYGVGVAVERVALLEALAPRLSVRATAEEQKVEADVPPLSTQAAGRIFINPDGGPGAPLQLHPLQESPPKKPWWKIW